MWYIKGIKYTDKACIGELLKLNTPQIGWFQTVEVPYTLGGLGVWMMRT